MIRRRHTLSEDDNGSKSSIMRDRLIATWEPGHEQGEDLPDSIRWSNGNQACLDDYLAHAGDTNFDVPMENGGIERHFLQDLVADILYDWAAQTWVLKGPWWTTALQVPSPDAEDFVIRIMASALPVRFKVIIHRSP